MGTDYLNPMASTYDSVMKILKSITIKYSYLAEAGETDEATMSANEYIDAVERRTDFDTYSDYTYDDMVRVGITDYDILSEAMAGNYSVIPNEYREPLYEIRIQKIIDNYVEKNNYYRMLNGYPDLEEDSIHYFYITDSMAENYGINKHIPIHQIQDYYNKIEEGSGDYYISLIEGSGYIDKLYEANPDKEYLRFIGAARIPIITARKAKNFQILIVRDITIKQVLYNEFTEIYEQCREYFVNVVFNRNFRSFFDNYDKFIALCIMVMAIQQLIVKQMTLGIHREFFDIYALKMLYETYGIPYNLNLDEDSQQQIVRNLNLFVKDKATNKVIYNIAEALGFGSNFSIYKYYLSRQQKVDSFGVPIFRETKRFNDSIGEMETVPDYEAMYDVYFHKAELRNNDFVNTFNDRVNTAKYEDIVTDDPYWWLDEKTFEKVWETEYNFVESKYFGISVSYRITDMIFENIVLMKMLISKENETRALRITLPKISGMVEVPIFDIIILLICLTSAKHNLTGEIVSIPTDVLNVLEFMSETGEYEGVDISTYLANAYSFNFDYFNTPEWEAQKKFFKKYLSEEEYGRLIYYTSVLSIPSDDNLEAKVNALNTMYDNIKNLYIYIERMMTSTKDIKIYRQLRILYQSGFYSKEMKNMFDITGELSGYRRTAFNFFEYLHTRNPALYDAVFEVDYKAQYEEFINNHRILKDKEYPYEQWLKDIETGKVDAAYAGEEEIPVRARYDKIKGADIENTSIKEEKIYFYINHCISRLQHLVYDINFTYMLGDSTTPLENLLIKMIRFFKSYTTELINMDAIYVVDLKPDNILKLYDEMFHMIKNMQIPEELHVAYSDVVRLATTDVLNGGKIGYIDKYLYDVWIWCDKKWRDDYSKLDFHEAFHKMFKDMRIDTGLDIKDEALILVTDHQDDRMPLVRDMVAKMYYT